LLVERLNMGLRIVLLACLLFATANLMFFGLQSPALLILSGVQVATALRARWLLGQSHATDRAVVVGLAAIMVFFATGAASGILIGDDVGAPLGMILATLGAAALLPWSLRFHLLTAFMAVVASAWNVMSVSGTLLPFGYAAPITIAIGIVASIWIARDQARWRLAVARQHVERQRTQQQTAALLAVAKDISGTLERAELLERVQRRIASVLHCDMVGTFYWDTERAVFRAIAHYGVPPNRGDLLRDLEFRSGSPFGGRLKIGGRVVIDDVRVQDWAPAELLDQFGIASLVAVPLAVGERQLGTLVAARSQPGSPFDQTQLQLFEGIARQLAVAIEAADLCHLQQEEVEVASALAMAGQELIGCTVVAELVRRLCRVTTAVVGCDCSHTWLWQPKEEAFAPVASFGDTPEQWQARRLIRLPRDQVSPVFESRDVTPLVVWEPAIPRPQVAALGYGLTVGICAAFRRGGEIIGVQTAGFRSRLEPFSERQQRIAQGIARLAAPALERAQLTEELGRANRLKSEFVAAMSHELRTPLNVIIGYNELLTEGQFGALSAAQSDTVQRMHGKACELLALIDRTLDVSRLDDDHVRLELSEVGVAELLAELAAETSGLHDKPGVHFTWCADPGLPRLYTDAVKVKLALKNLIENALKFTDQGRVTVAASASDGGVEIRVTDTGVGMAPEALPVIFEPFRQCEAAGRRGGVGLGLYIARRLVDMVGGQLTVESEPERGSTFHVHLPESM